MYNYIFFTNVIRLLDEKGMSQQDLHAASGVSASFLSDLTNGQANPSLDKMEQIAKALNTPLPLLLEVTDLTKADFSALSGGILKKGLPAGYERVFSVVTEHQAFIVRKWEEEAKKKINTAKKDS